MGKSGGFGAATLVAGGWVSASCAKSGAAHRHTAVTAFKNLNLAKIMSVDRRVNGRFIQPQCAPGKAASRQFQ
jgi:hypothetical protein